MKQKIPKALREQVWLRYIGRKYDTKCTIQWCQNRITVFDFHIGHNIPESKGGSLDIYNLLPICSRCNASMGNVFSISEWDILSRPRPINQISRMFSWVVALFRKPDVSIFHPIQTERKMCGLKATKDLHRQVSSIPKKASKTSSKHPLVNFLARNQLS